MGISIMSKFNKFYSLNKFSLLCVNCTSIKLFFLGGVGSNKRSCHSKLGEQPLWLGPVLKVEMERSDEI